MSLNRKHTALAFGLAAAAGCYAADFSQPNAARYPDLYRWTDTCNVYVLRDGDAALLIDLGDGSVLDHLGAIGVKRIEWVLFTHHHREQCQGAAAAGGRRRQSAAVRSRTTLSLQPRWRGLGNARRWLLPNSQPPAPSAGRSS